MYGLHYEDVSECSPPNLPIWQVGLLYAARPPSCSCADDVDLAKSRFEVAKSLTALVLRIEISKIL